MKTRDEIPLGDRWDVEAIFPSLEAWRVEFDKLKMYTKEASSPFSAFRGRLNEGAEILKELLDALYGFERKFFLLFVYAQLRNEEDISNDVHKSAFSEIESLDFETEYALSWFEPELMSLSEEQQKLYLESPVLKEYRFTLERNFRQKKHTLSKEAEELYSLTKGAMETPFRVFSALDDADIEHEDVMDSLGNTHELTHANYEVFFRDHDRTLREQSYKIFAKPYQGLENTFSELINGNVQKNLFRAKARGFLCPLQSALFDENIDMAVYRMTIQTLRDEISAFQDYFALKEKVLKIKPLRLWDQLAPITKASPFQATYDEAVDHVVASVAPLGEEYQTLLKKGLKEDRWVDRYESLHKRSGAFSSGSYDTHPYILINFKGLINDVFTLAHESGHSMHSLYSDTHQPYHTSDYPIFLAEIASTFNEELLSAYFMKRAKTTEEKIFFLNNRLEEIYLTLFKQTLYAEFELNIHEMAEKEIPLTPQSLKEAYLSLCHFYYGEHFVIDPEIELEWTRIPHLYLGFYVFQYVTGLSASMALSKKVLSENKAESEAARERYLNLLKSGSSNYPLELLKTAGIDMSTNAPIKSAVQTFRELTKELQELLK